MKIINAASDRHAAQMRRLGEFAGAEEISYVDHGNGETYTLKKGDNFLVFPSRSRGWNPRS